LKISLNWLKDFINLSAEVTAEEIASKLTFAGFEVESVAPQGAGLENVVVGEILERNRHPNADRLSLTKINVGAETHLEIVCGAQNIAAGQKIPVALVGAKLPNGLEIKASKIRGSASEGMLCSLDELCLPADWQKEDGIFQLESGAKIGMGLSEHLGLTDVILEVSVTPNRGDALSHLGIARELAALYGLQVAAPSTPNVKEEFACPVILSNKAPELCLRYFGRSIRGVKVGPSPAWLKKRIEAIGLRSVNNVVDCTAYTMFELGQPLHAFDQKKLGKNVGIRLAREGEKILTLSGKEVSLLTQDLLITGDERPAALAGVMGGLETEVDDGTTELFLESAEFLPISVRKTGRRLALLTDAGYRFERGVDPLMVEMALQRATELILKVAGGEASSVVSAKGSSEQGVSLRLRLNEVAKILGKSPDIQKVISLLRGLGLGAELSAGEQGVVQVSVPPRRRDLKRTVDLVEEVARIWGFEHLEGRLPLGGFGEADRAGSKRRSYFQVRRIRRHLASLGFAEALNYGFDSQEAIAEIYDDSFLQRLVKIQNPVSSDFGFLKPGLLSGLLRNAELNLARGRKDLRLFEVRRGFLTVSPEAKTEANDGRLQTFVEETGLVSILATGNESDGFWDNRSQNFDFFSLKGMVESVFEMLGLDRPEFRPQLGPVKLHPGQAAEVWCRGQCAGWLGRVHPALEKKKGFESPLYVAEIKMDSLVSSVRKVARLQPYSNFPTVDRDFSLLVKEEVLASRIEAEVKKVAKPLLKEFHFFDVYRGERVPAGHVSYAFRITLGADDRTLTDNEIQDLQSKVMKALEKQVAGRFAGLS
jgi:phenylalanyl-tRNA synthetase beta chain